jgi:hypothetical protein
VNWLPSEEGPSWATVPHDESMTAAQKASSKLFFILFFSYINNISYLRILFCYAITVPRKSALQKCAFKHNITEKNNKKQKYNGKRSNQEVRQLFSVV